MRLWTKFSDDYAYKAVYVPTWQHLRGRAAQGLADGNLQGTLRVFRVRNGKGTMGKDGRRRILSKRIGEGETNE